MEYGVATKCIYGNGERFDGDNTGAISFPIYQTATYAHPEVGKSTGFDYSRLQNPTRQQAERVVAAIENGVDALAFSSGMAAVAALFELFAPGDHIITDRDLDGKAGKEARAAAYCRQYLSVTVFSEAAGAGGGYCGAQWNEVPGWTQ